MPHILVVHHDADLYGADQSLLRAARAMKRAGLDPILVLPFEGPLLALLRAEGIEVHVGPVGKVSRSLLRPTGWPVLLGSLGRAVGHLDRVVAGRDIALCYSNSIAVLGGALWAHRRGVRHLFHVREIVVTPRSAAAGFPRLLRWLGDWCVCNSHATRRWLVQAQPVLDARSSVIWNGLETLPEVDPATASGSRRRFDLPGDAVVATLAGRINRWKGQGLLIEAAARLRDSGRLGPLRLLIVGDVADGQHHLREDMLARIRSAGLEEIVRWQPFMADMDAVWSATDIALAPSTDPEPFGRVAIEAMARGLPVIAASHGGLVEIVVDGETGRLFEPGSAAALADALAELAASPALRQRCGEAGRRRQAALFTQQAHDLSLVALLRDLAAGRTPSSAATPA